MPPSKNQSSPLIKNKSAKNLSHTPSSVTTGIASATSPNFKITPDAYGEQSQDSINTHQHTNTADLTDNSTIANNRRYQDFRQKWQQQYQTVIGLIFIIVGRKPKKS